MAQQRRSGRSQRQSSSRSAQEGQAAAPAKGTPPQAPKRSRTAQEAAKEAAYKSGAQAVPDAAKKPATKPTSKPTGKSSTRPASRPAPAQKTTSQRQAAQKTSARKPASSRSAPARAPEAKAPVRAQERTQQKPPAKRAPSNRAPKQPAEPTRKSSSAASSKKSSAVADSTNRASKSSGRQSSRQGRQSGRQSSRTETQSGGSMLMPIIIGVLILGGIGAGAFFSMQGEDFNIKLNAYQASYTKSYNNLEESLEDASLDMAGDYYDRGIKSLDQLDAYIAAHSTEILDPPDTKAKRDALNELHDRLPFLKKIMELKKEASGFQKRIHEAKRCQDLDGLTSDVNNFLNHPKIDGVELEGESKAFFLKQVAYLKNAPDVINEERQRRQQRITKPSYKTDTRNDLQKRGQRSAYQSFTKGVSSKLEENKFSHAYKTALAFHQQHPLCDIDEDWNKIVAAENAYWTKEKSVIEGLLAGSRAADLQSATNKLAIYFDMYGNESFGDEARALYAQALSKAK